MTLMRGAIPSPRHVLAAAVPHFPMAAPAEKLWLPNKLSWWGNNVDGDCVTAEEAFAKACHDPEIFLPDADVVMWAGRHGYLNGAALTTVMDTMQQDGFPLAGDIYRDGPHTAVDWSQPFTLTSAISQGPVKIAVAADQLENVVSTYGEARNGWVATGFIRDENTDHCVSLCGYGSRTWLSSMLEVDPLTSDDGSIWYAMFTWSSIGIIDHPSLMAITAEAWLRNPTTIV